MKEPLEGQFCCKLTAGVCSSEIFTQVLKAMDTKLFDVDKGKGIETALDVYPPGPFNKLWFCHAAQCHATLKIMREI